MNKVKLNKIVSNKLVWLLLLLVVLAVIAIYLVLSFSKEEISYRFDSPFYQYNLQERIDYTENDYITLVEDGIVINKDGDRITGDDSPFYECDSTKIILPKDYIFVEVNKGIEYKIPALSSVYVDKAKMCWANVNNKDYLLGNGFITDCAGTYIFVDKGVLTINGEDYEASPLSFYSSNFDSYRFYQQELDELKTFKTLKLKTTFKAKTIFNLNLSMGTYTDFNGEEKMVVSSPKVVKSIEEK